MKSKAPYFPRLEAEISKRGILKKDIAAKLGITPRAFSCKLAGKVDWWWREIQLINSFFPDIEVNDLFCHNDKRKQESEVSKKHG